MHSLARSNAFIGYNGKSFIDAIIKCKKRTGFKMKTLFPAYHFAVFIFLWLATDMD